MHTGIIHLFAWAMSLHILLLNKFMVEINFNNENLMYKQIIKNLDEYPYYTSETAVQY